MTAPAALTVAVHQGEGVAGDVAATVDLVARSAAAAAAGGADLLVFPEGFLTGYHLPALRPGLLPDLSPAFAAIGGIAARNRIALVVGSLTEDVGIVRNSAIVYAADGRMIGRYHKRALFGRWERAAFTPGSAPLAFKVAGYKVGVLICYDVEFPELVRHLARAGVDLVVVPTALMAPHDRIVRVLVPARAMENQIFLAYANRTGHEAGLDFVGLSSIVGPDGTALDAAEDDKPGLLVATLPRALIEDARAEACYLDDLARLGG